LRRKERSRTESRGIESRQRHAPICTSFIHIHISSVSCTITQPVIFSVNGNREHTPEGIRPVLKAGKHGSENPKEPVPKLSTVLKTLIEEPVWIFDHGSQNPGRTGPKYDNGS
jgi:hypothetical protein